MTVHKFTYVDIETCPLDKDLYLSLDEENRKKLLNPLDSRIVTIGLKHSNKEAWAIQDSSEGKMLSEFWREWAAFRRENLGSKLVGFNIKDFDLPFLVTRSFIHNIPLEPFNLKEVVELREHMSAFRYGPARGKLKEFAQLMGLEILEGVAGDKVAEIYWSGGLPKLAEYVKKDLEITEAMHQRMIELKINEIQKW